MTDKKAVFVIDPAPTIKWPVIVSLPADGGEVVEYQFTGIFKRLSEAELDEILGVGKATKPYDGAIATAGLVNKRMPEVLRENAELFPKLITGWEGVKSAAGDEVEFSIGRLQGQITGANGAFLSAALWRAIAEIRNGARLGN